MALCEKRTFKQQAVFFLNAFWDTRNMKDNAELIWGYVAKCQEIDIDNREKGCTLNELEAHRLLEAFDETMTVREMRTVLRKSGAIGERVKNFPLTHYLIAKWDADWHILVNAKQGDNAEELAKAQALLDAATQALDACLAAFKELKAAEAELKAQEDAYNNTTKELEQKSQEGGVVTRNRAKAQLAAHLAEDPLPLRRAKITNAAAVKKADRALKKAQEAYAEAEAYLKEVSAKGGSAAGSLWWMSRELHESKKFLPLSKGGVQR